MRNGILIMFLLLLVPALASAQISPEGLPEKLVTTASITGVTHWSADTVYILTELVYVQAGNTLIIEPGTIVKGQHGTGADAKALIVARNGKIYAMGTPAKPIIFTSIDDNVLDPGDIPLCDDAGRGRWPR